MLQARPVTPLHQIVPGAFEHRKVGPQVVASAWERAWPLLSVQVPEVIALPVTWTLKVDDILRGQVPGWATERVLYHGRLGIWERLRYFYNGVRVASARELVDVTLLWSGTREDMRSMLMDLSRCASDWQGPI